MRKDPNKLDWYRHLGAPGVEFRWEVACASPKAYKLRIRSVADNSLETHVLSPTVYGAGITHALMSAQTVFANQIQQRILDERKRRSDSIDAREAKEREVAERTVPEPEGAREGQLVENDKVPASNDGGAPKESTESAGPNPAGRGKRGRRQPKARADAAPAVHQAGS